MTNETAPGEAHDSERLIRIICFAGFLSLPVVTLFVHLLLIYRA